MQSHLQVSPASTASTSSTSSPHFPSPKQTITLRGSLQITKTVSSITNSPTSSKDRRRHHTRATIRNIRQMVHPQMDYTESTTSPSTNSTPSRRAYKLGISLLDTPFFAPNQVSSSSSENEMTSIFVELVPARTLSGCPREGEVEAFIESVILNFGPKEKFYAAERREAIRIAILGGKAAR